MISEGFLNPRSPSLSVKLPVLRLGVLAVGTRLPNIPHTRQTVLPTLSPHGHLQLTNTKINRDIDIIMQWKWYGGFCCCCDSDVSVHYIFITYQFLQQKYKMFFSCTIYTQYLFSMTLILHTYVFFSFPSDGTLNSAPCPSFHCLLLFAAVIWLKYYLYGVHSYSFKQIHLTRS